MFGKKKTKSFDKEKFEPVIRCSICTGEQTAGFKEIKTGHFIADRIILNDLDLKKFMDEYDVKEIKKEY